MKFTAEDAKKLMFHIMDEGISFIYDHDTGNASIKIGEHTITPPFKLDGPWPKTKEAE